MGVAGARVVQVGAGRVQGGCREGAHRRAHEACLQCLLHLRRCLPPPPPAAACQSPPQQLLLPPPLLLPAIAAAAACHWGASRWHSTSSCMPMARVRDSGSAGAAPPHPPAPNLRMPLVPAQPLPARFCSPLFGRVPRTSPPTPPHPPPTHPPTHPYPPESAPLPCWACRGGALRQVLWAAHAGAGGRGVHQEFGYAGCLPACLSACQVPV